MESESVVELRRGENGLSAPQARVCRQTETETEAVTDGEAEFEAVAETVRLTSDDKPLTGGKVRFKTQA